MAGAWSWRKRIRARVFVGSSGETRRGEERGCSSVPADLCQRAGIKCVARGGEASRGMEEERRKS